MEKILVHLTEDEIKNFLTSIETVAQLLTKARNERDLGITAL